MKPPVSDAAVAEYVARLRAGVPLGTVFPTRMSDCDFTESQREVIRLARLDRRHSQKEKTPKPPTPASTKPPVKKPVTSAALPTKTHPSKSLAKLGRLLYLQSSRCFFCGELLTEADASIEHLNPKSRGGTSTEDNEVVCHKSLNQVFGAMGLKDKFAFVLKSAGSFKCPKK